tara:strand:- start:325 stop:1557 length:1233 start_codon:yes stop_codon:yes gene_type:complete
MNLDELTKIPTQKIKYGLTRTIGLLKECNIKNDFLKIQIIGTNGKGSVAAFLSTILRDAGYRVGTYTSPHLIKINERIQVDGKPISNQSINLFLSQFDSAIKHNSPSFFEIMTAMSMWYFNEKQIDIGIMEAGLGGRLDSTTACNNHLLLFTAISMDHHDILGNSIQKITKEKAGAILKKQQHCISVEQPLQTTKILSNRAQKIGTNIIFLNPKTRINFKLKFLSGFHQIENANLAKEAIDFLNVYYNTSIKLGSIKQSIYNTRWNGRFQIIAKEPTVIYDVAHNKASLDCFLKTFIRYNNKNKYNKKYLVCAFEHNKQIVASLKQYCSEFDYIVCTETKERKSMQAKKIQNSFQSRNKVYSIENMHQALSYIIKKAKKEDIIVLIGSHFMAPFINRVFKNCFVHTKEDW